MRLSKINNLVKENEYLILEGNIDGEMIKKALAAFEERMMESQEAFKKLMVRYNKNFTEKIYCWTVIANHQLDLIDNCNNDIWQRLEKVEARLDKLEKGVQAIKNCPTIKKELSELN